MWNADDAARAAVRRQGEGLSVAQVADQAAEAARQERETRQQLDSPALDRGPYDGHPEDLAEQWVARHAAWRRITALMDSQGSPACSPERDVQGSTEHRSATHSLRAPPPDVPHGRRSSKTRDELKAQEWLPPDASRQEHAIAARTGLGPENVLTQLADRVHMNDNSTLTDDASPHTDRPPHIRQLATTRQPAQRSPDPPRRLPAPAQVVHCHRRLVTSRFEPLTSERQGMRGLG